MKYSLIIFLFVLFVYDSKSQPTETIAGRYEDNGF